MILNPIGVVTICIQIYIEIHPLGLLFLILTHFVCIIVSVTAPDMVMYLVGGIDWGSGRLFWRSGRSFSHPWEVFLEVWEVLGSVID